MCVADEIQRTGMYVKTKKKVKIEICQFDSTGCNILIFHTKNGGGKLNFGIDVAK